MLEDHIYRFRNREYSNRLHFYWRVFDDTFMKPWLIRDYDPETHKLKKKLKFDEFGAGKLNLKGQLIQSVIKPSKETTYEMPLKEPLLKKNEEGPDSVMSTEHRLDIPGDGQGGTNMGAMNVSSSNDSQTAHEQGKADLKASPPDNSESFELAQNNGSSLKL